MLTANRVPIAGYATVIACFLLVLFWQQSRMTDAERQIDAMAVPSQSAGSAVAMIADFEALARQQDRLAAVYGQARSVFKAGFLLLIVLPTAVLFPLLMAGDGAPARKPKKPAVLNVKNLTRDEVDQEIPHALAVREKSPQQQLFMMNALAFGIPTLILIIVALAKPEAYGGFLPNGIQAILLFAVGTLIVFCGTAMVHPLKRSMPPARIAAYLGGGYLILAALAWLFL